MNTPSTFPTSSARLAVGGVGLAAIGAIAASGKAIIVKLGLRHGVDATTLLALRMAMALPLFLLLAWWSSRRAAPLSWADRGRIAWLGFTGYYLSSWLDFQGLQYISVTLERLILYLNPTLVLLIHVVLTRQRPGRWQLVALALSYAGVLVAFGHDLQREGGQIILGSLLVLGSAISYALYLFGSGQIVARIGAVRLTAQASCVACALVLLHFGLTHPWPVLWQAPHAVHWLSLINATACTVLPVLAIMLAVKRIGSSLAAQVGMLGPVSTIVMSLWLLDEPMGPAQIAGTVLVLCGVLLVTRLRR
ncbi:MULTISPECIES: DMT family transporter [unclassified Stenotrophomonas]|uniref:DMT family transporter n=1 Tax=unclassified Stenotrophomonas TaxID=196198 RepID=UPI00177D0C81|nr:MULTISPECIES: DMT family transporter [unclassified Stenotrophomonas]MBD8636845.1 DMT family transporter [Stenotrophomonas sp. CFBP 13725]MBD8696246.1 DMT family transporter [Stenotrophomonas sp. CFBP 13718]